VTIKRVVPNIGVESLAESRDFYVELFGVQVVFELEPEDMVFLASPTNPTAQIQLFGPDGPPTPPLFVTVEVTDVDAVHAVAVARGLEIVEPLHDRAEYGVRRFRVRDPNGVLVNVMMHLSR